MEVFHWAAQNWFDLLQSLGIIGGLLFTCAAFKDDTKARRTANLIEITKAHREIWTELYDRPELTRVSDRAVDLEHAPMKPAEELFIGLLILHLNTSFQAMKAGVFISPDGLRKDIGQFFSAPMARIVWTKMRALQDGDFIRFVESCFKGN
jgi:hypothetical protein